MDDLISKGHLMETLGISEDCVDCQHRLNGLCLWKPNMVDVCEVIAEMPSAQQWIPVTERLPEEECKHYWICTDRGYQCECRWTNVNHFWTNLTTDWHWNIFDVPQYSHVVAWRPLPEPWKGEDE